MRIVADNAGFARGVGMTLVGLQILVIVAVSAKLQDIFHEQRIFRRLVRVVARSAILDHVMLKFCLLQKVVVAVPAQCRRCLLDEIFVV